VGVVLGSGLGAFADAIRGARAVSTADVPGFPASTVPGHAGRLVGGALRGVPVLAFQGRVHGYEGYSEAAVTFGIGVLAVMGARGVILTNAAGAVDPALRRGDLMLVNDHLNLSFRRSTLLARETSNVDGRRAGETKGRPAVVYSERLAHVARLAARDLGIRLREGNLVYGRGPSYETAAEVRMYRKLGGHAACMSTVPEAVAAHDLGLEVLAISCISNLGTGLAREPLRHDDVTEAAAAAGGPFAALLEAIIERAYG
jgi:purine-nucleoside phosphorylase